MIKETLHKLIIGKNLNTIEAKAAMEYVMAGHASPAQIGSLITALRMKGETVEEIAGCAQAMRNMALPIKSRHNKLIDTCGTGGDCSGTFNISTTAAFVAAAGGLPVAKHGNRSVSSKSGSADVLEALGVRINLSPQEAQQVLDDIDITFLFAPAFHLAMKHAVGPRRELGFRSIFNILGPLTNPAQANIQLLGVPEPDLTEKMAQVLEQLGVETAYVVHGAGGLDEVSTLGATKISSLQNGSIKTYMIEPEEYGLDRAKIGELSGGDASHNAKITRNILEGCKGPHRDIVLLNGAVAFLAGGLVEDITEGVLYAAEMIDSGKALGKLEELIAATNRAIH